MNWLSNSNLEDRCDRLAGAMFGGVHKSELPKFGLTYRKGKTWTDVVLAGKKGLRAGMGKTENERSMISCYLSRALKKTKDKS